MLRRQTCLRERVNIEGAESADIERNAVDLAGSGPSERLLRKFRAARKKGGAITHPKLSNARNLRDDANAW